MLEDVQQASAQELAGLLVAVAARLLERGGELPTAQRTPQRVQALVATSAAPMSAEELKERRQAAGLSQEKAAHSFGVSMRTWVRWEAGSTPIAAMKAALLRRELGARG